MVLSGNVTNFQFLLRQEKQLAEIQTSGLQNHVRISQFLKEIQTVLALGLGGYL